MTNSMLSLVMESKSEAEYQEMYENALEFEDNSTIYTASALMLYALFAQYLILYKRRRREPFIICILSAIQISSICGIIKWVEQRNKHANGDELSTFNRILLIAAIDIQIITTVFYLWMFSSQYLQTSFIFPLMIE